MICMKCHKPLLETDGGLCSRCRLSDDDNSLLALIAQTETALKYAIELGDKTMKGELTDELSRLRIQSISV